MSSVTNERRADAAAADSATEGTKNATSHRLYPVRGMSCASCAASVESMLGSLDGVEKAQVNFATEKVSVYYDSQRVSEEDMAGRVKQIGYELLVSDDAAAEGGETEEERAVRTAWKRLAVSATLAAIVMALMVVHMFVVPIPGYLAITAVLGAPVVFGVGRHVHRGAIKSLLAGRPNMDVLVSLGSFPPFLVGLAGFFLLSIGLHILPFPQV